VRTAAGKRRLRRLIATALAAPVLVDVEFAAATVRPYRRLINRVGADGITLTAAGYLPPIHVEAAWIELDLRDAWIGKGNREDLTIPVLHLRESAQRMGLLRKHRGRLLATARGKAVCRDPVALWRHLAERMPASSNDRCERQAGVLYLLAVAAEDADPDGVVVDLLGSIGWMTGDGAPLSRSTASRATWGTRDVLQRRHHLRKVEGRPDDVGDWIVVDGRRYFVAGYAPGGVPYGCFEDEIDESPQRDDEPPWYQEVSAGPAARRLHSLNFAFSRHRSAARRRADARQSPMPV
jgi:hypothetical protein